MLLRKLQAMKARKGFTLVELIVVIAIIAILAAILIPILLNYLTNSRISRADSEAKSIFNSIAATVTELDGQGIAHGLSGVETVAKVIADGDIGGKLTDDVPSLIGTDGVGEVTFDSVGRPVAVTWDPTNAGVTLPTWDDAAGWKGTNGAVKGDRNRSNVFGAFPELPA